MVEREGKAFIDDVLALQRGVLVVMVVVMVVATRAICTDSGHFWWDTSIYGISSVHGWAIDTGVEKDLDR